jgi:hypothetical protein
MMETKAHVDRVVLETESLMAMERNDYYNALHGMHVAGEGSCLIQSRSALPGLPSRSDR